MMMHMNDDENGDNFDAYDDDNAQKSSTTMTLWSKYNPFKHYYLVKKKYQTNRAGVDPPPFLSGQCPFKNIFSMDVFPYSTTVLHPSEMYNHSNATVSQHHMQSSQKSSTARAYHRPPFPDILIHIAKQSHCKHNENVWECEHTQYYPHSQTSLLCLQSKSNKNAQ